jgi:electron transfer flavoprotein beta subunit
VGGEGCVDALRKGMAMGAHKSIHINDPAFSGADAYGFAKGLAAFLAGKGFDLILTGKQSQDTDSGVVPGLLAGFLGVPVVTNVEKVLEAGGGKLTVKRKGDNGGEVIDLTLPAVLSTNDSLNTPRLAALRGIMAAKKKPLETLNLAGAGVDAALLSSPKAKHLAFEAPEGRKEGQKFDGDPEELARKVVGLLVNEAKVLA